MNDTVQPPQAQPEPTPVDQTAVPTPTNAEPVLTEQPPAESSQAKPKKDKKPLPLKVKSGIWAGSAALIVILSFALIILPEQKNLKKSVSSITANHTAFLQKEADANNLITAQRRHDEFSETLNQLNSVFIDRDNPFEALSRIENAGAEHDLTLNVTIPALDEESVLQLNPMPLRISTTGSMEQLTGLINTLLSDNIHMRFDEVVLNNSTPYAESESILLSLTITTYWK